MVKIDITGDITGPIYDGSWRPILDEMKRDIDHEIGVEAESQIQQRLRGVLRNPTGRYQSSIGVVREGMTTVVSDGGIVYGPWLEGTGSRNRTTRFKGYKTFRLVLQDIQNRASEIARSAIERGIRRLNGGG